MIVDIISRYMIWVILVHNLINTNQNTRVRSFAQIKNGIDPHSDSDFKCDIHKRKKAIARIQNHTIRAMSKPSSVTDIVNNTIDVIIGIFFKHSYSV